MPLLHSTLRASCRRRLLVASCAALSLAGCEGSDEDPARTPEGALAQTALPSPTPDVPDALFVETVANGTGCPSGTTSTSVSSGGSTFTTKFAAYVVTVGGSASVASRDCFVSVRLQSSGPVQYALTESLYVGYAKLDARVRAVVDLRHGFVDGASGLRSTRVQLDGPVDRAWQAAETVRDEDLTWSRCGLDATLLMSTRIQLRKDQDEGSGYVNLTEIPEGGPDDSPGFRVKSRPCVEAADDAGQASPTPATGSLDGGSPVPAAP